MFTCVTHRPIQLYEELPCTVETAQHWATIRLGIDTLIANILVWLRFVITYSGGFVCDFSDILPVRHESMRNVAGDDHFCHVLGKHMHWQSSSTGDTLLGMFITAVAAVLSCSFVTS